MSDGISWVGATAKQISRAVRRGDVSATQVVADTLEQIAISDPSLDAFRVVRGGEAITEAEKVDDQEDLANLPLAGVPVAVKENTAVAGLPTWDGSAAQLYVNGQLADATNEALNGVYNASAAANFIVAASDSGSPYTGSVDEVAFYGSALTPAQILSHFNTVSSATPGAYQQLVRTDGALLQLSNGVVPEPSALALLGAGAALVLRRRRA